MEVRDWFNLVVHAKGLLEFGPRGYWGYDKQPRPKYNQPHHWDMTRMRYDSRGLKNKTQRVTTLQSTNSFCVRFVYCIRKSHVVLLFFYFSLACFWIHEKVRNLRYETRSSDGRMTNRNLFRRWYVRSRISVTLVFPEFNTCVYCSVPKSWCKYHVFAFWVVVDRSNNILNIRRN